MNIDELIAHLNDIRRRQGGLHPVVIGQRHPKNQNSFSTLEITKELIRENIDEVSFTSVPGYEYKAGWVVFEIPKEGIKHRL